MKNTQNTQQYTKHINYVLSKEREHYKTTEPAQASVSPPPNTIVMPLCPRRTNSCCNIACLTFKLPHYITGPFHSHAPTSGGKQCTFHQVNEFCISRGSAVTFFRCDGQVHNHGYSSFYSEIT